MNDYKELIEDLRTYACSSASSCGYYAMIDAIDAIEQLVKERDAAVEDLKTDGDCDYCKHSLTGCKKSHRSA